MGVLSKLLVALGLDATDYQKGLDAADRTTGAKMSALGSKLEKAGTKMRNWGLGLTAGVTTPLAAMGLKAIDAASDTEESLSKVGVVFGEMSEEVIAFSDTAATALGMSRQEALEATGTYGNLFTAMGLGQDVSADMSTSLVTLASDLASFNNAVPTETLDALRAGLTGETEPLKRFGVNINAAAVGAKALELGLADVAVDMTKVEGLTLDLEKAQAKAAEALATYGEESVEYRDAAQSVEEVQERLDAALGGTVQELTSAQKAQAIYAIIMEQTTNAQGDFARTADGLANSTRIAKAQLADAAATMGQHLLPIGLKVVGFVNNLLERFQALSPETQRVILVVAGVAAAIGPLLMVGGTLISTIGSIIGAVSAVGGALGGVVAILTGPVGLAIAAVIAVLALLYAAWTNDWGGIRTTLTEVWESTLKPALSAIWEWLKVHIPEAIAVLSQFWQEKLLPAIRAVWEFLSTYIVPIFAAIGRVWIALVKKELEILAGIWQNVLKPALEIAWDWIQNKLVPAFETAASVVSETLGPALNWLKTHVLDPVAGAFAAIGRAVQGVIRWINDLATRIQNLTLPDWLTSGSPAPIELVLAGMNQQLRQLNTQIPRFQHQLEGLGGFQLAMGAAGAGAGGASIGGDRYEKHNYDRGSAALSWAVIEERRRQRLNASMGG
jgi:hypothetical protein